MQFWWASQGKNYAIAIGQGSLWTTPWHDGTLRKDRALIKDMRVGEIVFHYANGNVRAVSRVVADWVPGIRPDGYPKVSDRDLDAGWLVRVEPIATGLKLGFHELSSLITVGAPGPLDKDGSPQQKYLSAINGVDGRNLLHKLGINIEAGATAVDGEAHREEIWDLGATDAVSIGRRRREQGRLRAYLLNGRTTNECALCGRVLPASMLVAAHIMPRAKSVEEQRKNFASIAMLACSLGCDAIFELGYIVVDEAGIIRSGRSAETVALKEIIAGLVGRRCTAHTRKTAQQFSDRARLVSA